MLTGLKKTTIDDKGRIIIPRSMQLGVGELFAIFNVDHILISSEKPEQSALINTVGLLPDGAGRVLLPQIERDNMGLSTGTQLICKGIGDQIIIAAADVFQQIQKATKKTLLETLSLAKTHPNP